MGSLPTPLAPRLEYDVDGSMGFGYWSNGAVEYISQGDLQAMNEDDPDTYHQSAGLGGAQATGSYSSTVGLVFPTLRDIVAVSLRRGAAGGTQDVMSPGAMQTSPDTTDGTDGTWATVDASHFTYSDTNGTEFRQFEAYSLLGIKGIRFSTTLSLSSIATIYARTYTLHLYGAPTDLADGLEFWHPTLDQRPDAVALDLEDVAQGEIGPTRTFRVKNTSATDTAADVTLSVQDMGGTTASGIEVSPDGVVWASTLPLGTLAPGAISSVFSVRRTVGAAEAVGPGRARLRAAATSWS